MDIFGIGKIKKVVGNNEEEAKVATAPALPSLDEIKDRILKAKLLFRQTLTEAEAASQKSQELHAQMFGAAPALRDKMRQDKSKQDEIVQRKLVQAQGFAKSADSWQDVQVVMEIDQAFAECGLLDKDSEQARSLTDIQKALEEASFVMARTMEGLDKLGLAISVPGGHTQATSAKERELDALWAEFDKETDPVKKEEIRAKIEAKDAPAKVTL